jgi:hypothetical protein
MVRLIAVMFCVALSSGVCHAQSAMQKTGGAARAFDNVPLTFEENRGQADERTRYLARSAGMTVLLTGSGYTLSAAGSVLSMQIAGTGDRPRVEGVDRTEGVSNYYIGPKAITGIPHFRRVRAYEVRPGVDAVFYGQGRRVEYDYIFRPGSRPQGVRLRFEGADRPVAAANGDLVLRSGAVEFRQHKPIASQDGKPVKCAYSVLPSGEVRFAVGAYDHGRPLIIDPILSYSTFLGGTGMDTANAIAVDSTGAAYITGHTEGFTFPVAGGPLFGQPAFVAKLSPSGSSLIYCTYVGGSGQSSGNGIAVDAAGNAFIAGTTSSADFPGGGYHGGGDAFAMALGSTGILAYAVAIGGTGLDRGNGIAIDAVGAAYVTGDTQSTGLATAGAYQTVLKGHMDGFVTKVSPAGAVAYTTYLGSSGDDSSTAIAVDASGNAYVTGWAGSSDFPITSDALDRTCDATDAFVSMINAAGNGLIYSSFLGGASQDHGTAIAIDANGAVYVAGWTNSYDFPTTSGTLAPVKASDVTSGFVTKFVKAPNWAMAYSTYINAQDGALVSVSALAVDTGGHAYVAGSTQAAGSAFPTTAGAVKTVNIDPAASVCDMFVSELAADGSAFLYSTLMGSSGVDEPWGIAIDGQGGVYVAGSSTSSKYPVTPGAVQLTKPSGPPRTSGVISKLDFSSPTLCNPQITPAEVTVPGEGGTTSFNLTLAPGCPWEAVADPALTISGSSVGMGSSSAIPFSVTAGPNTSPTGTQTSIVRIDSATFSVHQSEWRCPDPVLTPASLSAGLAAGTKIVSVNMPVGCSWTAAPSAPWMRIISGDRASGAASMVVYIDANSFSARSGSIMVAGKTVTVTQSGGACTATATVSSTTFGAVGGTGTVRIATDAGCAWTAYGSAPWVQMDVGTATGQGTATFPFRVAQNPASAPRIGTMLIGDQTVSITQSGGPVGNQTGYAMSVFAGGSSASHGTGDGRPASSANVSSPANLVFTAMALYIADSGNNRIRAITPDSKIDTVAGGGTSTIDGVAPTGALLSSPYALASDAVNGYLYFSDGSRVRRMYGPSDNVVTTIAGTTTPGFSGDNGPAVSAQLNDIRGIAIDASGAVYVADYGNNRVRKVSGGVITTFAGGGSSLGDGSSATVASLRPSGVAVDSAGAVYISDAANNRIRKVSGGIITTFAGGGSLTTDGVPATSASLSAVGPITVDGAGAVHFVDAGRVRKVGTDGMIYSLTPNASYDPIQGIAADLGGNIYFSDRNSNVVRKLTPSPPAFCSPSIAQPALQPARGGSLTISFTAPVGCSWNAAGDDVNPWLTVSGGPGTGSGSVTATLSRNGGGTRRAKAIVAGQAVTIIQAGPGGGDFDVSGTPDLVWQNDATRQVTVHYYGGSGGASDQGWNWLNPAINAGWRVVAVADFDGNGVPDLVWQNEATRQVTVHYYGGAAGATDLGWNWLSSGNNAGWRVVAAADFDGNGVPDLVWQNDTTRQVTVHYYVGASGNYDFGWSWLNAGNNAGWRVVAVADFNGDGVPDLVWQNDATRQVTVHYYGGSAGASDQGWNWLNTGINTGWRVMAAADFNGDGAPDLVWQHEPTRQVTVNYYGGPGGAVYQGWNWLFASAPGWSLVNSSTMSN